MTDTSEPEIIAPSTELNVYQIVAVVKGEVGAIGKKQPAQNSGINYPFRRIDDIFNAAHGPMSKHGLVVVPDSITGTENAEVQFKNSTGLSRIIRIRFKAYGPAGDSIPIEVQGEANDTADKASNKAHTAALKIAVSQLLMIPYEEMIDQDDTRLERADQGSAPATQARRQRAASDHVTADDVKHLETIMGDLTQAEKDAVRDQRKAEGISIASGSFTVGGLRRILELAQEQLDARTATGTSPDGTTTVTITQAPAAPPADAPPARRSGAMLASKQQRETVAKELAELAPDDRANVEGWAQGAGHVLGDGLAKDSFTPVMSAIRNAKRAAKLKGRRLSQAPAPAGEPPAAPPASAEEQHRALRRQQWSALAGAVEALGQAETWPMVMEELVGQGITQADATGAQVALAFVAAGADQDSFLAEMVEQYSTVAADFSGRPFVPGDEEPAAAPSTLEDVDY